MRGFWWFAGGLGLVLLSMQLARGLPDAVVLRFADMTPPPQSQLLQASSEGDASETLAAAWLWQRGWEQVWPLLGGGKAITLAFAGLPAQRYLYLSADIALRSGGRGTVQTDHVNLLEVFRQQFPDYWQEHQQVPPVIGVSFEARSDRTASLTIARLYTLAFQAANE